MFKKSFSIVVVAAICFGCIVGYGFAAKDAPVNESKFVSTTPVQDDTVQYEIVLPTGGMPSEKEEVPTAVHRIDNVWDKNKDIIGITGGSAITFNFDNVITPEDGFTGAYSGGAEVGFGSGPHGPGMSSDFGPGPNSGAVSILDKIPNRAISIIAFC